MATHMCIATKKSTTDLMKLTKKDYDYNPNLSKKLVIETEIPRYLNLAKPLDKQDDANINTLAKSICEARTSMRKYHDAWPVFVHMKELGYFVHPGAGSNENLCTKELVSTLLFLGIEPDPQFTNIFILQRAKAQLLADLSLLGLSVFQASMMWFIIEQASQTCWHDTETASPRKGGKEMELCICINLVVEQSPVNALVTSLAEALEVPPFNLVYLAFISSPETSVDLAQPTEPIDPALHLCRRLGVFLECLTGIEIRHGRGGHGLQGMGHGQDKWDVTQIVEISSEGCSVARGFIPLQTSEVVRTNYKPPSTNSGVTVKPGEARRPRCGVEALSMREFLAVKVSTSEFFCRHRVDMRAAWCVEGKWRETKKTGAVECETKEDHLVPHSSFFLITMASFFSSIILSEESLE
ncbi:hypothetical protein DFH09DRAFT_1082626 [Mycena vulgaris]|nr:hypothetical protein DFH09DRAFT_1082626 [Mycena vulgaris]